MASRYPSQTETTNFARLSRLVLDVCSDVLRDVLDTHIPPPGLHAILRSQKHNLRQKLGSRQLSILYPPGNVFSGTLEDLDFSLLYSLVRNIQGINISPHKKGWGREPDAADRSLAANIDRLRIIRNETYGHLPKASLSDTDFRRIWGIIRRCVSEIEQDTLTGDTYVREVDNLLNLTMDPDTEKEYIERPKKQRDEFIAAVEELKENVRLQEYSEGISGTVENPCNITIAVVGHQGVGKSCLVKQLIRESIPEGGPGSTDTADFYVNHLTYNPKTRYRQKLDENGEVEAVHHRIKRIIEQFRKGGGAKKRGYANVPEAGNKESTSDHTAVTPEVTQGKKELPKEQREVIDKIMLEIPDNDEEEGKGFISIFDFGGERVFYNTHHCFLSSNMVFVLVIDVSMCLDQEKSRTGYEITEYWLKNIATYSSEDKTEAKGTPPIILVGSHLDLVSSDTVVQKESFVKVLAKLQENLQLKEIIEQHVQEMFAIANLNDSTVNQDVYEALWQKVTEIAPLQSHWRKAIPSKCVALELELIRLKNQGQIILTYEDLLKVNSSIAVPLHETEIHQFLRNFKFTGTFLCFNMHTRRPFVILQPQWIIDGFKQIITDQHFKENLSTKLFTQWKEYEKSGVLTMEFAAKLWSEEMFVENFETLCIVMESLSLIAKPITNDPNTEVEYFIVPCMLQTANPELILPVLANAATTVTLCIRFNKSFIPRAIWDKMITSCIHRFEKLDELGYGKIEVIQRSFVSLKVNAAWNMILNCQDNALKVAMFTNDTRRSTAGVGVSLCSILENLLQRILEQNHQSHLVYQFYLHNDYRFTTKDKMVKKDELETFGRLECFGINGRTWIKKDDIYIWFKDPKESVDEQTTLSAGLSADLPERKLTLKEIGRVSKYIGSSYQTFFVGLGCPSELLEQEMEEHRHLVFRSRITKILIQLTKRKADLKFRTVAEEMKQNGMDPEKLIEIIDCNRTTQYRDERLPDGWLQELLSVNDVQVIARYISVKAYFNLFIELGFQPEVVDLADFKYRNKPEHTLKALLETFITETQPPPTRNTILLSMKEFDMDTESLITAFIA
ncbi:LOW QUALITY PROTEIN: uncharacterized protein [Argopecten irradians]|uniref:LOW QUALITY PROTEIN: uncharacterized protein n=1 Tax=Argopecten irradians TaxID=31199 RepID=UPI0037241888